MPDGTHTCATCGGSPCRRQAGSREKGRGDLWRGRVAPNVMEEIYLVNAIVHRERNPVQARLVDGAERWPWSIAAPGTTALSRPSVGALAAI